MIAFIADFFDILGGAEQNDSVLYNHLNIKTKIVKILSHECTVSSIQAFDKLLIGNFTNLSEEVKQYICKNTKYTIYEHDHKYVSTRDPSIFKNFIVPKEHVINSEFYKNAEAVICLGKKQVELISSCLDIPASKLHSISGSLWSSQKLDFISNLLETQSKKDIFGIVDSANPIKNTRKAIEFCQKNKINYELFSSNDPKQFLTCLSGYKGLVFFPAVLESMCRLVIEAKMLNCQVITTPKKIGAFYEDWIHLSGKELIKNVRSNVNKALQKFEDLLI